MRWRCRRGVRELDVLLTEFLDNQYQGLDQQEKMMFNHLLEVQDPTIMAWLFGHEEAPNAGMAGLLDKIRRSTAPRA